MLRARNIYLTCKHDVNRKKILLTEIHTKSSKSYYTTNSIVVKSSLYNPKLS